MVKYLMKKIIKNKYISLFFLLLVPIHIFIFFVSFQSSGTIYFYIWAYLPFFSILGIIIAIVQIYKKVDKNFPIFGITLISLWLVLILILYFFFAYLGYRIGARV